MSNIQPSNWQQIKNIEDINLIENKTLIILVDSSTYVTSALLENLAWLNHEELTLANQRKGIQKLNYICSRYIIKHVLAQHYQQSVNDISVRFDVPEEKLKADGAGSVVSLCVSHSHGMLALLISLCDEQQGIDIELINNKRDYINIAKSVFAPVEINAIEFSQQPDKAFYALWTQKEAIVKATALSLSYALGENTEQLYISRGLQNLTYSDDTFLLSIACCKKKNLSDFIFCKIV